MRDALATFRRMAVSGCFACSFGLETDELCAHSLDQENVSCPPLLAQHTYMSSFTLFLRDGGLLFVLKSAAEMAHDT